MDLPIGCDESVKDLEEAHRAVSEHAEVLGFEVESATALPSLHPLRNVFWVILLIEDFDNNLLKIGPFND